MASTSSHFASQKGHNFFDPQHAWQDDDSEGVSVFLVCNVLHNWADEYCVTILKHLRAAAAPETQLLIVELGIAEQSRVWWCPTSVFWGLPLHAMGPIPSGGGITRYFSDLYISSYTPTLSTLIISRRPGTYTSARLKLLVARPSQSLPGAWADTQLAQGPDLETTILTSGNTTPTTIRDSLRCHQFVHIPFDVTLTANPFDTTMSFYNGGRLSLLDIVRSRHPTGECALLLGSHTAELTGEGLPNEVLHFTAALQYSRYRSVIGTLWEVDGEGGEDLTENIYWSIFSRQKGEEPYYERSAKALQHAVQQMRLQLPLVQWVSYVHYGA